MAENTAGRKIWNYSPGEPIRYNPLFDWPIHPLKVFTWMIRRWISISRFLMFIILGFVISSISDAQPSNNAARNF